MPAWWMPRPAQKGGGQGLVPGRTEGAQGRRLWAREPRQGGLSRVCFRLSTPHQCPHRRESPGLAASMLPALLHALHVPGAACPTMRQPSPPAHLSRTAQSPPCSSTSSRPFAGRGRPAGGQTGRQGQKSARSEVCGLACTRMLERGQHRGCFAEQVELPACIVSVPQLLGTPAAAAYTSSWPRAALALRFATTVHDRPQRLQIPATPGQPPRVVRG